MQFGALCDLKRSDNIILENYWSVRSEWCFKTSKKVAKTQNEEKETTFSTLSPKQDGNDGNVWAGRLFPQLRAIYPLETSTKLHYSLDINIF